MAQVSVVPRRRSRPGRRAQLTFVGLGLTPVMLLLMGPGEFSLDALLFGRWLRREDRSASLPAKAESRGSHQVWAEERRISS